mmetsp:Transcript_30349/g.48326  ORF Transcript_30349/g.48326 Transcript_30349/m.48326 type:complete len:679 (-) Transcript_30349:1233-3269(-)|eukprot:CAMPEP_0203745374 /NCGR_PEP_ID=MMETSP0098-20131031/1130_1 /ASSEMBLY_ACC=CAM_ASM_000208 /TAXON_ID=96639 /ORGANISM=" , Strain NY0313808BC1" /LENGTH=678 /DNA_ID=CAMNT_0050633129 /DNA_START=1621 /DNA_END=3657 /DNA_ORIENTATION=+
MSLTSSTDLYVLEQQIYNAEQDLAEQVRFGEVNPTPFVALKCERLYRTVAALQKRRNVLLNNVREHKPHQVPCVEPASSLGRNGGNVDVFAGTLSQPLPYKYRKSEKWFAPRESSGEGEWEWKGRTIRVVKNVVDNDSELLQKLLQKAIQLEKRLGELEGGGAGTNDGGGIRQGWSEETKATVDAGEELGQQRIDAREAAKRELQKRGEILKKEYENNSAVAVQSMFRGYLGRKLMRDAKKEYDARITHEGAEIIQSRFRGYMARKMITEKKHEMQREVESAAATVLQSQYRGSLARKEFDSAKTVKGRRLAGCKMIQAWWRGCVARIEVSSAQKEYYAEVEELAAVMLQCAWRCHKARKLKNKLIEERNSQMEYAAAVMLQAAWRGFKARKDMKRLKRQMEAIKEEQLLQEHAERVQKAFHAKYFLNAQGRAAILIQSSARGFLERKRLGKLKAKRRKEAQEDAEIDRLLNLEAEVEKKPDAKIVYDADIEVLLEWSNKEQEAVPIHVVIRQVKIPEFQLRIEAFEPRTETHFYRKIDMGTLEQLLWHLFSVDENKRSGMGAEIEEDSTPMILWVKTGAIPKRKQLINWVLRRVWIQEDGIDGELCMNLGTKIVRPGGGLDKTFTSAIPPSSPIARQRRALERSVSPKRRSRASRSPKRSSGHGRTRDAYVVKYADE